MGKIRPETARSGSDCCRVAELKGWRRARQSGSHVIFDPPAGRPDLPILVIPSHPGDLGRGLLAKILKAILAVGMLIITMWYLGLLPLF